ncbi:MAG: HtaA domain-containing protein, partial [Solirubrobacterales bacterium]
PGLGIKVSKVGVALTGKAAGALNQTFHVNLFKAGLRLGHAVVVAQPKSVGLESEGSTDLTLDPSTAEALTSLGVAVAPVGPASVTQAGAIAFPITGGRANTSTFAGSIAHSGGISLSAGSTVVELTDFRIKVDQTPDLTAKLGDQRVSILDLDLSALEASVTGRKITLANATATLTAGAAAALNSAFGTTAFTEGLVLGNANVNAVAG